MLPVRLSALVGALGLITTVAQGVVTIGNSGIILDGTQTPAPWDHVAQIGGLNGSGVYLGNGYLLTVHHLNAYGPVFLNNVLYQLDITFGSNGVQPLQNVDLSILKIVGDPGLPSIQIVNAADNDLNQASVLIGWGQGKGSVITGQGWSWGGESTQLERWGTNTTLDFALQPGDLKGQIVAPTLVTLFDRSAGGTEAQLAAADSGSGLFQFHDGVWKLAGIGDAVSTSNAALYDTDLQTSGDQPDASFYVRVGSYRDEIGAAMNVPEPSSAALLALAGVALGWRSRRVRRVPRVPGSRGAGSRDEEAFGTQRPAGERFPKEAACVYKVV